MFNDRESIAPILLSMFLGLLVVLLLGGFVLNLIGNYRTGKISSQGISTESKQIAPQTEPKPGLLQRLKEKFPSISNKVSKKPSIQKEEATKVVVKPSNISDVQIETTKFLRLMDASDITELNAEKGEIFTTFIPHDRAFIESEAALNRLMVKDNKAVLQSVVKRHMVRGKVNGGLVQTLSGETLYVDFNKNTVTYGGIVARIVETRGDTIIIDKVLY